MKITYVKITHPRTNLVMLGVLLDSQYQPMTLAEDIAEISRIYAEVHGQVPREYRRGMAIIRSCDLPGCLTAAATLAVRDFGVIAQIPMSGNHALIVSRTSHRGYEAGFQFPLSCVTDA